MTEFIDWLRIFVLHYPSLQYLIIFLGAAFGGEIVMIAFGFLVAHGIFYFPTFFAISFVGIFSSDILWFLLGRTDIMNKLFVHRYTNGTVAIITEAVQRISKGNNFIVLLLANFMLASRIILIMYVSKTGFSFARFLYYEAVAAIFWLATVISIGFVSGLGFTHLGEIFQNIYAGLGFLMLTVVVIMIIQIWFKKMFTRGSEL